MVLTTAPSTRGHALVTGTSSGIGAAIARRLLDDGWTVTGVARRPTDFSSAAYRGVVADLATDEGCDTALAAATGVTAFVHAAGFLVPGTLGALDPAASLGMWRVHVLAAERLANALVAGLPEGGRIVLIGSRTAAGMAARSQYGATKAALVTMARSWAIELAPRGITANVVAPAATDTPMLNDPARKGLPPRTPPIGRLIRPEEIAGCVAFLLGPDAGAITGQALVVCGGSSL